MKATVSVDLFSKAISLTSDVGFESLTPAERKDANVTLNVQEANLLVRAIAETYAITSRVVCIGKAFPATIDLSIPAEKLKIAINQFASWATVEVSIGPGPSLLISDPTGTSKVPIKGVADTIPAGPTDPPRKLTTSAPALLDLS